MLHGRGVELARLSALIEDARGGTAGSVVVHGEPGMGKSALLAEVLSTASDVRVLRTQGLESESPLAFAALHRLLRPVLGLLERLPEPQAHALGVAFGHEVGRVDPFLVAVATLSMLTEAAEEQPVVCVIDDAHWLDSASTDALLFATRRLEADRVAMVFAARDTDNRTFAPDGVATLRLEGLDAASVRALLADNAAVEVAAEVTDRLLAETSGNPLALVELPTGLSDAQLDGTAPLPTQLMLTAGVERVFLDRSRRLTAAAQTLMLVAVADDTGQLATIQRAAAALSVPPDAFAEAERSGLITISGATVSTTSSHYVTLSGSRSGSTSKESNGLRNIISSSAALGGLAAGGKWTSGAQADTTTTSLTLGALNGLNRRIRMHTGGLRDNKSAYKVFMSYANMERLYNELQNQVRFSSDKAIDAGGWEYVGYNGMEIYSEPDIRDTDVFFVNMEDLLLVTGSGSGFGKAGWMNNPGGGADLGWAQGTTAFTDGYYYTGQLGARRRNRMGSFTALTA